MKKIIAFTVVLALILSMVCGCDVNTVKKDYKNQLEDNISFYPFYQRLSAQDKETYITICTAIQGHSDRAVSMGIYDSEAESEEEVKRIQKILIELSYEHPEYFWVNSSTCMVNTKKIFDKYLVTINLIYTVSKDEIDEKKRIFDEKINDILTAAQKENDIFNKVLYVYDTLLYNAEYDWEMLEDEEKYTLGSSAYSCIVDGKTICSGYSKAFNLLMQRMGIEGGVEFDSYDHFVDEDRHVWNYCKLDGEYYYFDLTWDDSVFDTQEFEKYIDHSHIYFAVTDDELAKTNLKMSDNDFIPECNGTKYNYYVKKDLNISKYSFELAKKRIKSQEAQKYVTLKFDSYEQLLLAEEDLLLQGKIYLIMPDKKNISYVLSDTNLHMFIFYD